MPEPLSAAPLRSPARFLTNSEIGDRLRVPVGGPVSRSNKLADRGKTLARHQRQCGVEAQGRVQGTDRLVLHCEGHVPLDPGIVAVATRG